MSKTVKPIPDGYHAVTPYLSIKGAADAIAFYKKAFGAEELFRMPMPDGRLGHAELQIGDSRIMLADEMADVPEALARSPRTLGGVTSGLNVYVADADAVFKRAVEAGATVKRPLTNQFYGDRSGTIEDPFGHLWTIATHVEDLSPEEMEKRMASEPKQG
jgi:PhnB protein